MQPKVVNVMGEARPWSLRSQRGIRVMIALRIGRTLDESQTRRPNVAAPSRLFCSRCRTQLDILQPFPERGTVL